ncbi:V-type ATP synthase subunit E family protein [Odoribacter lunatus]|uniref:V-type ATP synthase subunit E family protein n=1 Tax=Odoribacter lunatus TaxID=2941335 RepID=UPI00203D99E1|nr:V-type ATP synthase subunit E family protein [Odoribacter lunatus]
MENKLDILTKKLYDEGVDKARQEAEKIIADAKKEAENLLAEAEAKAKEIETKAQQDVENLKKKADSEMSLSARQALAALKLSITNLISGEVAEKLAKTGFEDKAFVQELLVSIVKKWNVADGNLDLEVVLSEKDKKEFESFIKNKYKELLDKGLVVKVGEQKEGFVIQPKDGSYQIAFSEALFEAFFNQYLRSFTKSLLYN